MYVFKCEHVRMCIEKGVLASEAICRIKKKKPD